MQTDAPYGHVQLVFPFSFDLNMQELVPIPLVVPLP